MKKLLAIVLTAITIFSTFAINTISVSAASKNPWDYSATPARAIYYVYPTMKGNDVKWVQQALNTTINAGLAIDGSFGPACKSATLKFQKKYGLSQDGSFGPATRSKMVSVLNSMGYSASAPKSQNKTLSFSWSVIQNVGYQPVSGPCGCYALAYARSVIDGRTHEWTEYSERYLPAMRRYSYTAAWSKASYVSKNTTSKQTVLKAVYDSINNGKPVILYVKGNGSNGHYVCVVGYQNVTNSSNLSESNFLIFDSATKNAFNKKAHTMTYTLTYSSGNHYQYIVSK